MEWKTDPTGQQHVLTMGGCEGVILQDTARIWVAQATQRGVVTDHDNFQTLEDAQAWCLTRLAEYAADGKCMG